MHELGSWETELNTKKNASRSQYRIQYFDGNLPSPCQFLEEMEKKSISSGLSDLEARASSVIKSSMKDGYTAEHTILCLKDELIVPNTVTWTEYPINMPGWGGI